MQCHPTLFKGRIGGPHNVKGFIGVLCSIPLVKHIHGCFRRKKYSESEDFRLTRSSHWHTCFATTWCLKLEIVVITQLDIKTRGNDRRIWRQTSSKFKDHALPLWRRVLNLNTTPCSGSWAWKMVFRFPGKRITILFQQLCRCHLFES